jgi:hypothetical protein
VIVCVSEERRAVMIAYDGKLASVPSEAELRETIDGLWTNHKAKAMKVGASERPRRMADAFAYLVIFLGVVTAWAAMVSDRSHEVGRVVPLEIRGVSDSLRFDPPRFTSIAVQLRSSSRELDLLAPDAVEAYIDVSASNSGSHLFNVHTNAPAGVEVVSAVPSTVLLQIKKRDTEAQPAAKR